MSGKASNVSINWYLHERPPYNIHVQNPTFRRLNFTVKFFSLADQEWFEFSLACTWDSAWTMEEYVKITAPVAKRIKLRRADERFKVGKVRCSLNRSLLGSYTWTIGGQKWKLGKIGKG